MKRISRRAFLQTTSTAVVAGAVLHRIPSSAAEVVVSQRLSLWEYRRGSLGGPWEAWRKVNDDANVWTKVNVPHCFNALDSVNPDQPYYQGPGWYRTKLEIANPFPNGRTLLHFEGAGQKTDVFVNTEKVGAHVGGYDEFVIDITEQAKKQPSPVPIAIMCDNSRDLEMIPSNLSDIFKDFATTLRPGNPVPRVNQKGLVERDFTLKEGYFVFQSYWAEKPMVHIYGHTWPVRWGERDQAKLVKIQTVRWLSCL